MPERKRKSFVLLSVLFLLLFVLLTFWSVADLHSLRKRLASAEEDLEVNIGREVKQQYEYDLVYEELADMNAKVEEITPRAEEAEKTAGELKDLKKQLKQEKKRLNRILSGKTDQAGDEGDDQ